MRRRTHSKQERQQDPAKEEDLRNERRVTRTCAREKVVCGKDVQSGVAKREDREAGEAGYTCSDNV